MAQKPTYEKFKKRVKDFEKETIAGKKTDEPLRESETKKKQFLTHQLTGSGFLIRI